MSFTFDSGSLDLRYRDQLELAYKWDGEKDPYYHKRFGTDSVTEYVANLPRDAACLYRKCLIKSAKVKLLNDCRVIVDGPSSVLRKLASLFVMKGGSDRT